MRVDPFAVDLADPLETAAGTIERREGFLVRVEADGVPGVGEATPLPGWTEELAACRDALAAARDAFSGEDPSRALQAVEDAPAARHGLTLAIADQAARGRDRPLYRQLGARSTVESVPVNAVVGDDDPGPTATAAAEAVARGFGTVKLKVGARPVESDVERVRAVRAAVGDDVVVRADANGAWTREEAAAAFERFRKSRVSYVEQPLPPADLSGMADLRGSGVGVAADESLIEHDLQDVLASGAADAVVLKPMVLGGPRAVLDAATRARNHGVDPVVTTTLDAAVARAAAVHVAAAIPHVHACGLATAERLESDVAPDSAPVTAGAIHVPQGPGHGVDLPEEGSP